MRRSRSVSNVVFPGIQSGCSYAFTKILVMAKNEQEEKHVACHADYARVPRKRYLVCFPNHAAPDEETKILATPVRVFRRFWAADNRKE